MTWPLTVEQDRGTCDGIALECNCCAKPSSLEAEIKATNASKEANRGSQCGPPKQTHQESDNSKKSSMEFAIRAKAHASVTPKSCNVSTAMPPNAACLRYREAHKMDRTP